jgi:pilus assembly protein CpaE
MNEVEGLKDKVQIVVNRAGSENSRISTKKAEEAMGRDVFWRLPNDYRVMAEFRNNGVPLVQQAPRAALTQSIVGLAETICGSEGSAEEGASPRRSGRWMSFWPGRSRPK